MRVLLLTRYPRKGASSRLRHLDYVPLLESDGFTFSVQPLFDASWLNTYYQTGRKPLRQLLPSLLDRARCLREAGDFDVVWLEKEALPFLPALLECGLIGSVPLVIDYDDATFHTYDRSRLWPVRRLLGNKIDRLMQRASVVVAGNEYLADRARHAGAGCVRIVPTTVDLRRYCPIPDPDGPFSLGWIGSKATIHYLNSIKPALNQSSALTLRIMGAEMRSEPGLFVQSAPWSEDSEGAFMGQFHAGIMPLVDDAWSRGKCGYKLIQYMAAARPVIASPVGVNKDIVQHGETGFLASSADEWMTAIDTLRGDPDLRSRMGAAGRKRVEERFSLQHWATVTREILTDASEGRPCAE